MMLSDLCTSQQLSLYHEQMTEMGPEFPKNKMEEMLVRLNKIDNAQSLTYSYSRKESFF